MIDIHTHTAYSDGTLTPGELLEEAHQKKLTIISITDHNTIGAYEELKNPNIREKFEGMIIPGIEITTTYHGETIEVLGYNFNLDMMSELLKESVLTFEEKQIQEYNLIKKQYQKIGVIFDEENIEFNPKKESCRVSFWKEIKSHPENNCLFLEEKSKEETSSFTRNEIYNPKSPLYVDESSLFPSLEKAIAMIHESGGLAFLAHTFAYSPNIANSLLDILGNYKLDGLECFYTTFTKEQSNYLVSLCKEKGLYMSGGSDFHGTRKINHNLGTGRGNLQIEEKIIEPWVKQYTKHKK